MTKEQEQTMAAFIQWLPQNIQKFEGMVPGKTIMAIASAQSADEVVYELNKLAQEGDGIIPEMMKTFQKSLTSKMFNGGKLKQLLDKYQIGGPLRKRGKLNAYIGSYPKYTNDGT